MRKGSIVIALVGPTSLPWAVIADEVERDLARLHRPGIEFRYVTTGDGPTVIRTASDVEAAAPLVVDTVGRAVRDGADAVIVDCTDDPGVDEASRTCAAPVIGPGGALRRAASQAVEPVVWLSGDELRSLDLAGVLVRTSGAATVVLGGTGHSELGERLVDARPDLVVLDPLAVAVEAAIAALGR